MIHKPQWCNGYKRRGHTEQTVWKPQHLCRDCMARKQRDDGVVLITELTRAEDETDEMVMLSWLRIAAKGV